MNDKITFPRLASMLADRSGRSRRFSEDFLREFFALISEQLEAGESVKVKGLGTFRLSRVESRRSVNVTTGKPMEISGHSKVVFVPAKELAEAVNAPFEAFSAIEISDDVDLSELFDLDKSESHGPEPFPPHDEVGEEEAEPDAGVLYLEEKPSEEPGEDQEDSGLESDATSVANEEEKDSEEAGDTEGDAEEDDPEGTGNSEETEEECFDEPLIEKDSAKKRRRRIFLISFGAAIAALVAMLAVWYVCFNEDFFRTFDRIASATALRTSAHGSMTSDSPYLTPPCPTAEDSADSIGENASQDSQPEEVPTVPSDALVYDTIGTTRYLTTMAKSHYGNFNFWPYIYEENKAILGHPDRIRPGTPVVIPRLSKYGVDPTNPEEIEKAKQMGVEIYARYGKKI